MKNKIYTLIILVVVLGAVKSGAHAQTKDSLSQYVNVAIMQNPGLKSQELAHQAFLEKIGQAGAFQDPELSTGFYLKPMDIIGGRTVGSLTLMQMLPWFGTRKSAKTEADHMAKMQFQTYADQQQTLILQVKTQWYVLQKLKDQLKNAKENKTLLQQIERLAISKFSAPTNSARPTAPSSIGTRAVVPTSPTSSGMTGMGGNAVTPASSSPSSGAGMSEMGGTAASGGMSDVLRVRLEIVEIENTIESYQSQITAEKAKFNALLNRDASIDVVIDKHMEKTDFKLVYKEDLKVLQLNNPMLGMITEQGLAYKAKAEMDNKMSYPMVGLGLQYMINSKTTEPMFAMGDMNGKDMIMPMATITLPIFRKKYQAQQRESKLWWQSSTQNFNNTLNTLTAEYYSYKSQLEDLDRVIKMYDKQTTLAQATFDLIVKEFISGKSDLTNVIQVQRQLLGYKLKRTDAISDYNTMVAAIQKILAISDTQTKR